MEGGLFKHDILCLWIHAYTFNLNSTHTEAIFRFGHDCISGIQGPLHLHHGKLNRDQDQGQGLFQDKGQDLTPEAVAGDSNNGLGL